MEGRAKNEPEKLSDTAIAASSQELDTGNPVLLLIKAHESRIAKLEDEGNEGFFKTLTTSASTSALFLGLVFNLRLALRRLHNQTRGGSHRPHQPIHQAVNSAAKLRWDLTELQLQTQDPNLQLLALSTVTPQILNDLSTAKAIMPSLDDNDIGISQLIILISESFTAGDLDTARQFVLRAVSKSGLTPFSLAEAKRYEGRYFFLAGNLLEARKSFESALNALGDSEGTAASRAYDLADYAYSEFAFGDCKNATAILHRLGTVLGSPGVNLQVRSQVTANVKAQFRQANGQHCRAPEEEIEAVLAK